MDKATYYVTVEGTINSEQNLNDAPYDFEIQATDEEIGELQALYQKAYNEDFDTFVQANLPLRTKERMKANEDIDHYVSEIYKAIYRLGSDETKQRIAELGLA